MYYNNDEIPTFKSILKNELESFIKFKRSNGFKYGPFPCYMLKRIDNFFLINNIDIQHINNLTLDDWMNSNKGLKQNTKQQYYNVMYLFLEYLANNKKYYIQLPVKMKIKNNSKFIPYIFSSLEINTMFEIAYNDTVNNSTSITLRSFYGLLCLYYSCGLRLNEALKLRIKDLNFFDKTLTIWNGKNNVSRLVPLSNTTFDSIKKIISINMYNTLDDYIFREKEKSIFRVHILYKMYKELLKRSSIPVRYDGDTQRIHDLRHTFAVESLKQMEQKGLDLYVSLPVLSVYLGHKNMSDTEYYLRLVQNEASKAIKKVLNYTSGIYERKDEFYED